MKPTNIWLKLLALAVTAMLPSAQAKFVPPSDVLVFRRDLLPVDVATMSLMSTQLTSLASGIDSSNPESLRTGVQLLALARALDPLNSEVPLLLESWKNSVPLVVRPNPEQRAKLIPLLWRTQSWLSSKEAGECGQRFAACLGDVLAKLDPTHPTASLHASEQGAWQGWVAPAADFTDSPSSQTPSLSAAESATPTPPPLAESPDKSLPLDSKDTILSPPKIILPQSRVATPLWVQDINLQKVVLAITMIELNAKSPDPSVGQTARFRLEPVMNQQQQTLGNELEKLVLPACTDAIGPSPNNTSYHFILTNSQEYDYSKNGAAVSAACAVLQAAAITGNKPTGVLLGQLTAQGELKLPADSWSMLLEMRDHEASRLVVPADAAKLLPGLLTMDQSDFFLRHDVFYAKNAKELIAFSAATPEPRIALALDAFAEIRAKAPAALGPFLANPFVIKRLESIIESVPEFASAQWLLVQARGNRPVEFSSTIASLAIHRALQPLMWLVSADYSRTEPQTVDVEHVQQSHEQCRETLDAMNKWIASSDRKTYDRAIEFANSARTYARACKSIQAGVINNEAATRKNANDIIRVLRNDLPPMMRKWARVTSDN